MTNHITPRAQRAIQLVKCGKVSKFNNGYKVLSETDAAKWYQVTIHNNAEASCDCADYTKHNSIRHECKHIIAARLFAKQEAVKSNDLWGKRCQAEKREEARQWWIKRYAEKKPAVVLPDAAIIAQYQAHEEMTQ